jgi:hypothetical protein
VFYWNISVYPFAQLMDETISVGAGMASGGRDAIGKIALFGRSFSRLVFF